VDVLKSLVGILLVSAFLYFRFKQLVDWGRELRESRYGRLEFYVPLLLMGLTIGSCLSIERATGSWPEGSLTVRRTSLGVLLVTLAVFVWWIERLKRDDGGKDAWLGSKSSREAFLQGKVCPRCNRTMRANRLSAAVDDEKAAKATGWIHRCECGEWTLFHVDGRVMHVDDRTGGR